jgi:broad specificity phosphatase PhoE
LVRHGESAANAGLPTISAESIPLTSKGSNQALSVAQVISVEPSLIVTSPYLRAEQTSLPTRRRFPSARVEEWPVEEFTYLSLFDHGETTANDRRPLVEEYWKRADVDHCDGGHAESFLAFIERVKSMIQAILDSEHERIAVFSHGQFIRAVLWVLLTQRNVIDSIAMREFEHFLQSVPFPNGAILKLFSTDVGLLLGPICVDHLD